MTVLLYGTSVVLLALIKWKKIQERAIRFINNDFSSPLKTLLVMSNTSPLHVRRIKPIASEVYKIVNDLSPSYIQDLVQVKVSNYDYNCGAKSENYSVRDQVISF